VISYCKDAKIDRLSFERIYQSLYGSINRFSVPVYVYVNDKDGGLAVLVTSNDILNKWPALLKRRIRPHDVVCLDDGIGVVGKCLTTFQFNDSGKLRYGYIDWQLCNDVGQKRSEIIPDPSPNYGTIKTDISDSNAILDNRYFLDVTTSDHIKIASELRGLAIRSDNYPFWVKDKNNSSCHAGRGVPQPDQDDQDQVSVLTF